MDPAPDFDDVAILEVEGEPASDGPTLVEPDQGWIADDEAAAVASEVAGDGGPLSAEESAIHVISEDEAPGLTWGEGAGYLEESSSERPPGSGGDTATAEP